MMIALVLLMAVGLEYVGHACFVLTSPGGTRVVFDPFNSNVWLGYEFPRGLKADAVLVTHPHFDHDADYYFPFTPSFRKPGRYQAGDVAITGIQGKHADPWGKEFGQINTVFVAETGGLRFAHLGDNGPLAPDVVRQMGRVDVLMIPVDDLEHILKRREVEEIVRQVKPRVVAPMHYALAGLSPKHKDMGDITNWLGGQRNIRRLESHRAEFRAAELPRGVSVWVFAPSPELRRWTPEYEKALALSRGSPRERREALLLGPQFIGLWQRAAESMAESAPSEAARLLERGLALTYPDDYESTARARLLLATLYRKLGRERDANAQERAARSLSHVHP